jgi:hypothetical protein
VKGALIQKYFWAEGARILAGKTISGKISSEFEPLPEQFLIIVLGNK